MADSDTPVSGYAPDMLDRVLKQSFDSLHLMLGTLQLVTEYGSELPDMTNAVNLKTAADTAERLHKLLLSAAVAAEDGCKVSPSFLRDDDLDLETVPRLPSDASDADTTPLDVPPSGGNDDDFDEEDPEV
jgi:hypothetical protein